MIVILKTNYMSLKPLKADSKGNPDSGIWEIFACEIRNPGFWNPECTTWNPESNTVLDSLTFWQADWSQGNISGLPGYPNPVKSCRIFMYYPWVIGDMLTWSLCSELFQALTRMVINSKIILCVNIRRACEHSSDASAQLTQWQQVTVNMFIIS